MAKWRSFSIRVVPVVMIVLACCNVPNPYFDDDDADGAAGSGSDQGSPPDGGTTDDASGGTSGSGGTGGGDSTGSSVEEDCTDNVKITVHAANAELAAPMRMEESPQEGEFAYSEVENEGTITFTVSLPCSDDFHIWGRTLDGAPGPNLNEDPDSYYVSVDAPAAITWYYGCQLQGIDEVWNWTKIDANNYGAPCDESEPVVPWLTGGTHTIRLLNREPVTDDGRVAGIARLLLTNDPNYVPSNME